MKMRISYARSAPGVFDAMESLDNYLEESPVERPLRARSALGRGRSG